jgi:iron complex transport system ATP-binding protein
MTLEAQNLTRRVRGRALVSDVSLCVLQGEVLGLVGPNGSGKSTLLRLMAGLVRPDVGDVAVKGRPVRAMAQREIARHIALVAQSAETSDRITVRDAVALGRTPWLDALRPWSDDDEAHVTDALARVDMSRFATRDWSTLSGGERQRAHIARALAQNPQILMLDEPTNHLDIRHQLQVLDLVGALGISTVIALHDLNHAMRCDRVAVLHGGRLAAIGAPAEVLTRDLLARVFGVCATPLIDPQDGTRLMRFQPLTHKEI